MNIETRLTRLEARADETDPKPVTIVVYTVDMAALRASPDAKVLGREVRRIVVERRPQ